MIEPHNHVSAESDVAKRLVDRADSHDRMARGSAQHLGFFSTWDAQLMRDAADTIAALKAANNTWVDLHGPAPLMSAPAQPTSELAARLRQSADHDGPQELKMVMRRVATALDRASQPSPAATVETGLLGRENDAFHRALRKYPEAFEALHSFWNDAFAGQSHERSSAGSDGLNRENIAKAIAYDLEEGPAHGARVATTRHLDNYHVIGHVNLLALADAVLAQLRSEPQTLPVGPIELKPITMSDIRLMAGEGKLTPKDVLAGVNAVLKMRLSSLLPRPHGGGK